MRVLGLTRYQRLGGPSRLRFYQYEPWLNAAGIRVDWLPLWTDAYLTRFYDRRLPRLRMVVERYARRLRQLRWARAPYDAIWIEAEVFPFLPSWAEGYLASLGTPIVIDYDDAVFHKYDDHRWWVVRKLLSTKIDGAMAAADLLVVGNEYLADRARRVSTARIAWLPSVIDAARYAPVLRPAGGPVRVGWIGTSETARYLKVVEPALAELARAGRIEVDLIGAGTPSVAFPYRAVTWTEASEVRSLQQLDIGIMPLPDAPWERGKCGYKLIQYMACGLPIVASPVGINASIVREGLNGFAARDVQQWSSALERLVDDGALRRRLGDQGRIDVEEHYCLQVTGPRQAELLKSVLRGGGEPR
jgi:glycosyltransferase involved in cell wall biosynthesis